MKHALFACVIAVMAFSSVTHAEERTVEIAVGELTCPSCSFIVASSMRGVPSVEIENFAKGPERGDGVYRVSFDDAQTSIDSIVEAVVANGYPAKVMPDG